MRNNKQRVTAFIDPIVVKRSKVRGALEGLTMSEIVEGALDSYTPNTKKLKDHNIDVQILNLPVNRLMISESKIKGILIPKHMKAFTVPR